MRSKQVKNNQVHRLFVYGTLRRDPSHEMFHLLAKYAKFIDTATVKGQLFDLGLGKYPGMVPSDHSLVIGELYEFQSPNWQSAIERLDEYEGCSPKDPEPHEYRRDLVDARLENRRVLKAGAYFLNQLPRTSREIPSGDYLAWRVRA